jgi:hypothetical protein
MKFLFPLFFILFVSSTAVFAQAGGKKSKDSPTHWDSPTRDPDAIFRGSENTKTKKSKKQSNKKFLKPTDAAMVKYEQQKKENAKKYAQMAKDAKKPQYSDPSYFGHKKKPKKRPVGKRKFCQECGIVH